MLPLSHRILLFASRGPRTARLLSRKLGVDQQTVYKTLRGLDDLDLVEGEGEHPTYWRTSEEVEVVYHPGRVDVFRDGVRAIVGEGVEDEDRCRAVTTRGSRCKLKAGESGFCRHHEP